MIAFEVRLNGKRICIAGAEDLAVLSAHVTASGKLGANTVPARSDDTDGEVFYSVGGLTARPDPDKDVHVRWKSTSPLRVGDVIQVKVLKVKKADRAKSRTKAIRKRE
ncbi:MAG TPA: hypothetical protein VGR35_01320 [Tepidisphaeraceae bacterium]|nr:hypothetical protein [Tepidisphaeraceae bacterium]